MHTRTGPLAPLVGTCSALGAVTDYSYTSLISGSASVKGLVMVTYQLNWYVSSPGSSGAWSMICDVANPTYAIPGSQSNVGGSVGGYGVSHATFIKNFYTAPLSSQTFTVQCASTVAITMWTGSNSLQVLQL